MIIKNADPTLESLNAITAQDGNYSRTVCRMFWKDNHKTGCKGCPIWDECVNQQPSVVRSIEDLYRWRRKTDHAAMEYLSKIDVQEEVGKMVDKHLIEEAHYLVAIGPETVKELGYKSMGIVFDIEIDPDMVIGHTGSPSRHDPFEEEEVEYLACEAEKADFTVTDIYWFDGGDEVAAAGKDLKYNGHKLAAKKVLDGLLVLDSDFKAYVQGLIDARCDKIAAGKFDE